MKKTLSFLAGSLAMLGTLSAQDANVSLSNLNSNNGYSSYNNNTKTVSGIFFEVLSDGDNSINVIPDFQVSLYLLPCNSSGSATGSTPVIVKVYTVSGMQQLSSLDYSNESVDLSQVSGLSDGMYRMGVWVNSDNGVSSPPDDPNDNAGLIQSSSGTSSGSVINYSSSAGIEKHTIPNCSVYPNPFSTQLVIDTKSAHNFTLMMYDLVGNLVRNETFNQKIILPKNNLNPGMYMIKVSDKTNGDEFMQKVFVTE